MSKHTLHPRVMLVLVVGLLVSLLLQEPALAREPVLPNHAPLPGTGLGYLAPEATTATFTVPLSVQPLSELLDASFMSVLMSEPGYLEIYDVLPDIGGNIGSEMSIVGPDVGVGEQPAVTLTGPTGTITLNVLGEGVFPNDHLSYPDSEYLDVQIPSGYSWVTGEYTFTVTVTEPPKIGEFIFDIEFCSDCKPARSRRAR